MIFKFIFGMLISAIGFLFILKTQWFLYNFGRIPFGEKYFGGGGSRLFYKLIGILISDNPKLIPSLSLFLFKIFESERVNSYFTSLTNGLLDFISVGNSNCFDFLFELLELRIFNSSL